MLEVDVIVPELGEVIAVSDTKVIIGEAKSVVMLIGDENGAVMGLQIPAKDAMTLAMGLRKAARTADREGTSLVTMLREARAANA